LSPLYLRIIRNSTYLFGGGVVSNLCLIGSNLLLANLMSPSDYGMVVLVVSINSIVLHLSDLGVSTGTTKFLAEYLSRRTQRDVESLIGLSFRITLISALISMALLYFLSDLLATYVFKKEVSPYVKISVLWILPYAWMRIITAIFYGFQEMKATFWASLVREPLRIFSLIILIGFGLTVERVMVSWTIAIILVGMIFTWLLRRFFKSREIRWTYHSKGRNDLIRYSLYLFLPYLGTWILPLVTNALIGRFGQLEEVSYFAASLSLASISYLVFLPLSNALMPAVSGALGSQEIGPVSRSLIKYVGMTSFFVLAVLCFWGDHLLKVLYGLSYLSAYPILVLLAFSVFFDSFTIISDPLLKGSQYARLTTVLEVTRIGLLLILGTLLIFLYGAKGAGITFLVLYAGSGVWKLYFVEKYFSLHCWKTFLICMSWVLLLCASLFFRVTFIVFLVALAILFRIEGVLSVNEIKTLWSRVRWGKEQ
jgi:O-antigen/teichoic acid export membrane protein